METVKFKFEPGDIVYHRADEHNSNRKMVIMERGTMENNLNIYLLQWISGSNVGRAYALEIELENQEAKGVAN